MAPDRKADPGPRFDWRRLAQSGLSVWPEPGDDQADFVTSARTFGFPGTDEALLLAAFRLRFRPWAQGPEAPEDRARADAVARLMRAAAEKA